MDDQFRTQRESLSIQNIVPMVHCRRVQVDATDCRRLHPPQGLQYQTKMSALIYFQRRMTEGCYLVRLIRIDCRCRHLPRGFQCQTTTSALILFQTCMADDPSLVRLTDPQLIALLTVPVPFTC